MQRLFELPIEHRRAKSKVTLMAPPEILAAAIEAKTTRASGLRDALWG